MFTLYEGFGLLESDLRFQVWMNSPANQVFGPHFRLVDEPPKVQTVLEREGLAPIRTKHAADEFTPLPTGAHSLFPMEVPVTADEPQPVETVASSKMVTISLQFPHEKFSTISAAPWPNSASPCRPMPGPCAFHFAEALLACAGESNASD